MRDVLSIKLLLLFAISFSLVTISGPLTIYSNLVFPTLNTARANPAPTESWYPAGPESNNLVFSIFKGQAAEFSALTAANPTIDMMDMPATAAQVPTCTSSANIFITSSAFCYTSYWSRVINSPLGGTPNFFTWLNAYSTGNCMQVGCTLPVLPQSPPLALTSAGTIRQGLATTTTDLNPYTFSPSMPQNSFIVNNVYDNLYRANPSSTPTAGPQLLDWMVTSRFLLSPTMLTYAPPPGTVAAVRNTLWPNIFWHNNGVSVTAWDVAFSYLSLIAAHAPQLPPSLVCPGLSCSLTGITVLSRQQFDFDLSTSSMPADIGSITILPAGVWSNVPGFAGCMGPTPDVLPVNFGGCFLVNPGLVGVDPLLATNPVTKTVGILFGSGPWECQSSIGAVGTGCSSNNSENPGVGGFIVLTRFGCSWSNQVCAFAPTGWPSYFRSPATLALYTWTGNNGDSAHDFLNISAMASCFQKPVNTPGCTHWQEGIGNPGNGNVITFLPVSTVAFFFGTGWTAPFAWTALTNIGSFPPVLYERTSQTLVPSYTFNPGSIAGCVLLGNQPPVSLVGYPNGGGYDC